MVTSFGYTCCLYPFTIPQPWCTLKYKAIHPLGEYFQIPRRVNIKGIKKINFWFAWLRYPVSVCERYFESSSVTYMT